MKRLNQLSNFLFKKVNLIISIISGLMIILYFSKFGFTVNSVWPSDWFNELSNDPSDWASFGAYMTPVFMMATIMVMVHTLSESKKQGDKQYKTIEIQQFETSFFNLLMLHSQIVNTIDIPKSKDIKGINGITFIARELEKKFNFVDFIISKEKQYIDVINEGCTEIFESNVSLYRYFTNLYHIYKFIDDSAIEDKKRYSNIVRAQLSNGELHLLFYNGLSKYGYDKFKPFIEKYSIFDNFDTRILSSREFKELYDPKAFK
ncbi:MAG: putative phage abortive infection protein [Flavobacteriales bacterium]